MDNNILDVIKKVYSKTICSELSSVKPDERVTEKMYKELCNSLLQIIEDRHILADDEQLSTSYDMLEKKWCYRIEKKELKIDESKDWVSRLTEEDWKVLNDHYFTKELLIDNHWDGKRGIADRDDNILIIRNSDSAWKHLAGREWYYNLTTKELKLVKMN